MDENALCRLVRLSWTMDDELDRFVQLHRYAQVGRCVNGVTHDINNYLGAVIAYSELVLADPGLSDESRQMLKKMLEAGTTCAHLIAALTNIARPDQLCATIVDMSKVVQDVLLMRNYSIRNARISLDAFIADDLPPLAGDAPKLQQAMTQGGGTAGGRPSFLSCL